jgi:SAM-dependent MidA family methyltransferase
MITHHPLLPAEEVGISIFNFSFLTSHCDIATSMNPLEKIIEKEIATNGPVTLARFMELALYHPEHGYYAKLDAFQNVGTKGDFITSISIGSLFGKLLAKQFSLWWAKMGKPNPFHLVECGGLDGQLAFDILSALPQVSSDCAEAALYTLVEPLANLEDQQRKKLSTSADKIKWVKTVKELPAFEGIIFGNELLDAFPIHLFEGINGKWQECCVGINKEKQRDLSTELEMTENFPPFKFIHQSSHLSIISKLTSKVRGRVEVCPDAGIWIQDAADKLKKGCILLLDYGLTDEEYLEVERPTGTVRSYRNHQVTKNILDNPGEQDITYHVRWTPLIEEAAKLKLQQEEFIQQGRWLTRIVAENQLQLSPSEIRQFQTLSHPEMMGAPFRVLVLRK